MPEKQQRQGLPQRIRIGASACLLGKKVRFDGGHKRSRLMMDTLTDYFELVSYCPEVAIGMGTPRQPIRLVGKKDRPEAIGVKDFQLNVTQPLRSYGKKVAAGIYDLSGFIFKKDSPSCGTERVKIYSSSGMPERSGIGLFAKEIMSTHPLLPVEEEGRLNDQDLRDNFIMRVYVYARWQALLARPLTKTALIQFHSRHKYLLLAHSAVTYQRLGKMLSKLNGVSLNDVAKNYIAVLMPSLKIPATRKQHTNVMQHLLGYLKSDLDSPHRRDLANAIESYRLGFYPLAVPLRLLQHHFTIHSHPYIDQQAYLQFPSVKANQM